MNRLFLLTIGLSFSSLVAEAQLVKGTKLLGGNLGYTRSTSTQTLNNPSIPVTKREYEQVNRTFNVSPRAGVFIADNLAAGISVGYNSQKITSPLYDYSYTGNPVTYQQTARNNSFNIAPFLRYYYMPTATFGVFGQLNATYSTGKSKAETTAPNQLDNEGKINGFGLGISPALVFFPVEKLGLELAFGGIGYGRTTSKSEATRNQPESKSMYSDFGANFGLNQLSVGASYYMGR
ncbi:hypothetical protein [Hymenobacter swuensis]|uniref:Outer membrane protein beta-barrel domain-containing protein n=1 Tax=Hymenobacter swuensis DY53 TaxID=1227739 RepID=W8F422_9BACT|nr:hypothetical protein [Hymenobacter swuensis]AHJ99723.1 hypothetical protein Hsw_4128 [Hymenobacter swuensis DY53]